MPRFISFKLGEQTCGIDVLFVREVNQIAQSTAVPLVADYVHGLINLRGQIVTILDLARRIEYKHGPENAEKYNIILKTASEAGGLRASKEPGGLEQLAETIGLRVDEIGDVIDVFDQPLEPPPANISELGARFLYGVYNLESTLLLVLNLEEILRSAA